MANSKLIAKNTILLYARMILIMGVSLYTSRVVLDKLGVDDYALYNVVGGVVGFLSFLNGTLSIGTSRFLTYELGTGNEEKLKATFCTSIYTHFFLAVLIVLLMETVGIWFMNNKLVIPSDRMDACFWVLQLSVLTTVFSVIQVPYTSLIMAYERMGIYAYISILEAIGKLLICFLLVVTAADKLIMYAGLIAVVQFIVLAMYCGYSSLHFAVCRISLFFDSGIFKNLLGFSGWNILANITETLKLQGVIIIINMFLSPVVVASQALANQVSSAMMQFVNNFRLAINPQIIKLYASGDRNASKQLTLSTTIYCFDLILLLGLPCIYVMDTIMDVWLVNVPEYAVAFTRWIIIYNIIGTFGAAFYIPMMAANKIKTNSMAAVFLGIGQFVALYFILKNGGNPMWIQYMAVIMCIGFSLIVKPLVLWKEIDYSFKELFLCYWSCFKVLLLSIVITLPLALLLKESVLNSIIKVVITMVGVAISSYVFLDKGARVKLVNYILSKIEPKNK